MWNFLKNGKLTDNCVSDICNAIQEFTNLECLTLHLGGYRISIVQRFI